MPEHSRPFGWFPEITVDSETGAIYMKVRDGKVHATVQMNNDMNKMYNVVNVDVDEQGWVLGVEIL